MTRKSLGDPDGALELAIVEAKGRRETAEYVLPLGVAPTRGVARGWLLGCSGRAGMRRTREHRCGHNG